MFKQITLKNYRTHKSTTIEIHPVTLLIGNNNSGKTNLLAGIQHFASLLRRSHPQHPKFNQPVSAEDYYPHRYRLARDDESLSISIVWENHEGKIVYDLVLYENEEMIISCREKIQIDLSDASKTVSSGYDRATNTIELRLKIEAELKKTEKELCKLFFRDCDRTLSYHMQPSFLKGLVQNNNRSNGLDAIDDNNENTTLIPANLGIEGGKFHKILCHVKEKEEHTFARFTALMRRLERSFHGIISDPKHGGLIWQFDLGRNINGQLLEEFPPDVVSDGLLKAAAISLLVSLQNPPALMMLEEIENGINPGNIQELMNWIWQATSPNQAGYAPQFIITSHSPSVLREFSDRLDCVHTFRIDKRSFQSDVRNLNDALDMLVGIGTLEGEIIDDEVTGKRRVKIPKYKLAELWYSGTIG